MKTLTLCMLVLLTLPSAAFAQRWGRGRVPAAGACFYRNDNFDGEYFCVDAGATLTSIPEGLNDKISSMRLFGPAEVTVYRDRSFHGRSSRFRADVRNLKKADWNDTISSLEVHAVHGGRVGAGDPDRVVRRAYQDVLDREPDAAGLRLYRSRIIDDGWSEAQVRDALRKSPEYTKVAVAKAHDIVRNAYQNVLKREPDAGASGYVEKVMRQHWTQADVERELRKSPEYRNRR